METKGIYPKHTSLERLSIESKVTEFGFTESVTASLSGQLKVSVN